MKVSLNIYATEKIIKFIWLLKIVLTIYLDHDCDKSIHSNVNQIIYKDAVTTFFKTWHLQFSNLHWTCTLTISK